MLDVIGFDLQDREITEFIEKLNELRELLLDDFGDDGTIKLHPIPNGSSYNFDPNEILFAEVFFFFSTFSTSSTSNQNHIIIKIIIIKS